MYDGFLEIGGVEIFNRARAAAYIRALLAGRVDVRCDSAGFPAALGHSEYLTPDIDRAAWLKTTRPAAARFAGFFPGKVEGAENSTHGVTVTEKSGDGAVITSPRYGAKEMRYVATGLALDEEAMEEGMAWLRDVLANDGCSDHDLGCTGRDLRMFATMPTDQLEAYDFTRTFHKVEVTDPPKVTQKFPVKGFVMWQVEFTVTAGVPWAFTSLAEVGTLAMDSATNHQDPEGENCGAILNAYDEFVADPYFTAISRPPRPPVILPPNLLKFTSWRRRTLTIPSSHTQRWGRAIPVVYVSAEDPIQYLRLRFYREGMAGCDYDGEFFISYVPANTTLTLNAITRQATMTLPDGKIVPAGHLLFGSDGTPFMWPTLGCQHTYTMTADLMPGQAGAVVILETAVRE